MKGLSCSVAICSESSKLLVSIQHLLLSEEACVIIDALNLMDSTILLGMAHNSKLDVTLIRGSVNKLGCYISFSYLIEVIASEFGLSEEHCLSSHRVAVAQRRRIPNERFHMERRIDMEGPPK